MVVPFDEDDETFIEEEERVDLMAFQVHYVDPETGYEWYANFETQEEALSQAATDVHYYGGEPAQEILDGETIVADKAAIIAEADKLD